MIFKKILFQTILNLANSFFAFLFVYALVHYGSTKLVGELYIALAACSMVLLVQLVMPPNFSLMRIQDKIGVSKIVTSFYCYIQPLVFIVSILVGKYLLSFDIYLSFLFGVFCCLTGIFNLFDVLFQAKARLDIFLSLQTLWSIMKLAGVIVLSPEIISIKSLISIFVISQIFVLILMFIFAFRIYGKALRPVSLRRLNSYLKASYVLAKNYYLSAFIKKIIDNAPAIVFYPVLSRDVIGAFSLYQKCLTFGVSLIRTIESLLLNRGFFEIFNRKILYIAAPCSQLFVLCFGAIYLYSTIGVSWPDLTIFSFTVYPISIVISERAKLLSSYRINIINKALLMALVGFGVYVWIFQSNTVTFALASYSFMVFLQALFLVVFSRISVGK
ncbi:hypothetical protein AAIA72_09120 [Hahella sp. SMD15-11]|uniref:Oligosaccharide flippase family protein n=1 Tax=Thermohahella caldifontis TaxID=3142973 RepID=A0AB39URT4_9GAMM